MKLILVGAGEVGSYLGDLLSRSGHDVTLIERSAAAAERVEGEADVRVIRASGSSARTLRAAGAADCDCFLALTDDDETNLVAASLAKALGACTTIARIHDETIRDQSVFDYAAHFGIDHLLNPERLAAVELAKLIRNPGRVAVEDFARGQVEVQMVTVSPGAPVIGRPLSELRLGARVRVGLVQRDGATEIPTARTTLRAGDQVTLFGAPEALFEERPRFVPESGHDDIRVVILGGGEIGVSLAGLLRSPRFRLRLIERDRARAEDLARKFPHATIVQGEGTSLRLLEDEQVGDADFFVACSRDDEDNVMTALQAGRLGARRVLLAVNRTDYHEVVERMKMLLGVEAAVSPRLAMAEEVLRQVSREPVTELARLAGDAVMVAEFRVAPDSACDGKCVRDVPWPPGTLLVAQTRRGMVQLPAADDLIAAHDRLVAVLRPDQVEALTALVR